MKEGEVPVRKSISLFFFMMALIIMLLTTILYNDYAVSPLLLLLPLTYLISFIVIHNRCKELLGSFVIKIIMASWFIRAVLVPCVYVVSGYSSFILTDAGEAHINEASLLLTYELMATTIYLITYKRIDTIDYVVDSSKMQAGDEKVKNITTVVIVILILSSVWCVLKNRDVLALVSSIFSKLNNDSAERIARRNTLNSLNGTGSIPYRLFDMCIFYLQILIPASCLSFIIGRFDEKSKKGIVLALLIVVLSTFLTTDDNRDTICLVIACFLVVYLKYNKVLNTKLPLLIVAFSIFAVSFLFIKTNTTAIGNNQGASISSTLCSYFSAASNVSASLDVEYNNKLDVVFGDIVSGVPYAVIFFKGHETSVAAFNTVVHGYEGKTNMIMPLISYGYHYVSIFAPIFTLVTYCAALHFESKFARSNIAFNKTIYAVIFVNLAIAPCTLGLPSILRRCCFYIPLILLASINEKRRESER